MTDAANSVPTRWQFIIRHIAKAASGSVAALGFLVLLGWIFDIPAAKTVFPSFTTMKANTAVLFILLGGALWCASDDGAASRVRRLLGLAVALVAGITLAQDLFATNFGIDELLFRDPEPARYPGRMAPTTAVDFLLLGLALWLKDSGVRFRARQTATLLAALTALLALCGYLYGVRSLYAVGIYGSMAVHTALGFLVACCALLCARPTEGIMGVLMSNTSTGQLLRRVQPTIILVPIILGWFRLRGERAGYYDMPVGLAMMVLSTVILLTLLMWGIMPSLQRAELSQRAAQRALRDSEERLHTAQQVAQVGTFEWNIQTGVNTWTPELEVMYGLPIGGFIGTQPAWENLVHPEDRAGAVRRVAEAFETGAATEGEWRVVWPNGSVHWLAGRFQVFSDESGKPLRLTGINIDITERKQAEAERARLLEEIRAMSRSLELRVEARTRELALAKERLDGIISIAADAIVSTDDQQRITIFNKAAADVFGWTQDEVLGRPLEILLPEKHRELHRQRVASFELEETKARRMAERRAVFGLRKNGEEFPAEAAISKLKQECGYTFTVILRDISERVRVEDERQVFVSLLENSSDFIGIADPHGMPIYVNPAGRRMVGLPRDYPVEQTHILEYYPPEQRQFANDVIVRSMVERGHWSGETYFRHWQTGAAIPVSDEHFLIRDASGARVLGMGTVTRNITEARRAEAERARTLAEKETLLREIHHRVKNNLQVLSSLFYLQRQRTSEEPLRTLLDESRNRIQSIALIHEKLYQSESLARIDFADYLKDLTRSLTRAIGVQAPQARISIQADNVFLDIERAIPCALIVNELVSNALKHAFPGGRTGEIHITVGLVAPDLLELIVSDTGIGFPADLDFTSTTTLGMKLVCSLITQLRGSVTLNRHGGTRFEIRFAVPPPGKVAL